jgi:3-hydroxyisobutyrate dehydrogenase-like beta-hydroxyacid dehydrogenase
MASGSPDAIAAVTPVLSAFAKKVARVGDAGAGQSMKLAVNLVVHDLNAALSEALTLASRAGIDPAAAYDVFVDSAVAAPFVAYKREAFLTDGVPVAMSLDLVAKDLRLICELASELEVEVAATTAVRDQVAAARDAGFGAQDMASLQRYLAQLRPGAAAAPPPA